MRVVNGLNRRSLLRLALGSLAGPVASLPLRGQPQAVRIQVQPQSRLGRIPADFMGLGYEISSVSERGLLSGSNRAYVQFVRTLAPAGVIRIGGNTSDFASWTPAGPPVSSPKATVVDRRGIADLGTFLHATGWRLIWGFDLGQNAGQTGVDQAVDQAMAVSASAGDHLLAFEIGNEPDLFPGVHRPANYSYADYYAEYSRFKKAIREKLPNAPFAGPDVIVHADWLERFAGAEARDIKLLTHHFYAQGPPQNPAATIENLLKPNEILMGLLGRLESASRSTHVPYRVCEANSCFGGGKPGVSDTMAATLWGLDFLFTLARFNAAGVNMETGVNHLGFLSSYSPIGVDSSGAYRAQPLYYGMLAFALASRGERVSLNLEPSGLNITAYAVRSDRGDIWLTLINKEATREAHVRASCTGVGEGGAMRLTAPSLSSKDGVLLAGSPVSSAGKWKPRPLEMVKITAGEFELNVPAASAILLQLR
ncbi:MAG: hypothetical protein JOZ32_07690 [Bryobacterales bacterium]|nr:hypothetical protein [Bryobacterales bacterium]